MERLRAGEEVQCKDESSLMAHRYSVQVCRVGSAWTAKHRPVRSPIQLDAWLHRIDQNHPGICYHVCTNVHRTTRCIWAPPRYPFPPTTHAPGSRALVWYARFAWSQHEDIGVLMFDMTRLCMCLHGRAPSANKKILCGPTVKAKMFMVASLCMCLHGRGPSSARPRAWPCRPAGGQRQRHACEPRALATLVRCASCCAFLYACMLPPGSNRRSAAILHSRDVRPGPPSPRHPTSLQGAAKARLHPPL